MFCSMRINRYAWIILMKLYVLSPTLELALYTYAFRSARVTTLSIYFFLADCVLVARVVAVDGFVGPSSVTFGTFCSASLRRILCSRSLFQCFGKLVLVFIIKLSTFRQLQFFSCREGNWCRATSSTRMRNPFFLICTLSFFTGLVNAGI